MILIAHRGNTNGPNPNLENDPKYIVEAVDKGFDVEVDIWYTSDGLFLGHDNPQCKIEKDFLYTYKDKFWVHCKNLEAMRYLRHSDLKNGFVQLNYFGHDNDEYVLTSKNYLFCKPTKNLDENCVLVMPEYYNFTWSNEECLAVLTDFPEKYKEYNENR